MAHGQAYRDEIRRYTAERVALAASDLWGGGMTEADVLDLATEMLPAHERHDANLYAEMCGIATGAGITPAEAVVVGGFTDFVDTVRAVVGGPHPPGAIEDDCTAVVVPDHRAENGAGFYAQTWDMHDTATEYVVLLRIQPDEGPAALVFTTTGCLGQLGMNEAGVCVGINNLTSNDGRRGVTWPSVVREVLTSTDAKSGRLAVEQADLAGAHNFMVFDANGEGYNIEAMPSVRPVTELVDEALTHTNHTLDNRSRAVEGDRPADLQLSSVRRLETAKRWLDRTDVTVEDLVALTRDSEAICQVPAEPYNVESSGAAIMRPKTLDFWAVWGRPSHNDYQHVPFLTG